MPGVPACWKPTLGGAGVGSWGGSIPGKGGPRGERGCSPKTVQEFDSDTSLLPHLAEIRKLGARLVGSGWSVAPWAKPLSFPPGGHACRRDGRQSWRDRQVHFQEELPASGATGPFTREDRLFVQGD